MGERIAAVFPLHRGGRTGTARGWWVHRQLKKPFFGQFTKPWRWPTGVAREGWEPVRIASRSHSALSAIVRRTSEPPRGVVVCAHPMGLACKGFWLRNGHAEALLAAGWHVVAFDFNGFGDSPSTNFDWPGDMLSVGTWSAARFPGLPVHALTASFGAMNTLNAIGERGFVFRGVVAEGCAPSLPAFWKRYPIANAVLRMLQWIAPQIELRLRPSEALSRLPNGVRVLLVHSRADTLTPVAHGEALAAVVPSGADVRRLVLDRAEHTHALRDERDVYLPAVLRFLAEDRAPDEKRSVAGPEIVDGGRAD